MSASLTRPARIATGSALFVTTLGVTVLGGWFFHLSPLIQVMPQLPPVRRNAALCLLLCGLGLLTVAREGPRWIVLTCAGLAAAVSSLTIVEHVLNVSFGIDELLGPGYIVVTGQDPSRMPMVAALGFALSSLGLFTFRSRSKGLGIALVGAIVAALGVAAIMAHALGSSGMYGWDYIVRTPLLTSVGFLVLGSGMLALAWQANPHPSGTPRWLAISAAITIATIAVGLWQALIAGGAAPFAPVPALVLGLGSLMAPVFGLTVSLAQRGHAQAVALRRSETFLTEAQRLSRTGSFWWRTDTDDISFSDELYRIFAFPLGTPVTMAQIVARVHPDDLPLLAEKVAHARGGGNDLSYEIRLRMPDGTVKYLRTYAHGSRSGAGHLDYVGAMQDITSYRLADEALGAARAELAHAARVMSLSALTASIAHEVNQPLTGIMTNASTCLRLLGADPPNVSGARETARRALRDGNRVSDIITKLRSLYSGKDAAPETVDLNEAAREVLALFLSDLQRHGVVLRAELAPNLPSVMADRVQLQQVVLNLMRNALDAMRAVVDRPRELLVRTDRNDRNEVRLSVQDSGVGFAPEAADKLFGAFYTTKSDGMGMGLSVSRSIIERHHGRLWATSKQGRGATFTFSLPPTDTKV